VDNWAKSLKKQQHTHAVHKLAQHLPNYLESKGRTVTANNYKYCNIINTGREK
jgi:hypothetical protein